jgi:stage III sporulation protein AE
MKKRYFAIFAVIAIFLLLLIFGGSMSAYADEGEEDLSESIQSILKELDLSELDNYLQEHSESYLLSYGNSASEIIEYLIKGNLSVEYSSYISEIFNTIFKNVISLIPAFAEICGVALLCAVVSSAEGTLIGKSTGNIIKLACYSLIILLIGSMLVGIISKCITCIDNVSRQIEIITPILATLTVLTGGVSSASIYQPSALFLSVGAIEIVSSFVFPFTIAVIVLNFMSKLNPDMSFTGVTTLIKSIMKWVIGITVTVFSIFVTMQSSATSLFDGIIFKATKFAVSNSVPIVGNFLSSGFDMLASAGLLIKSSVGVCGLIMLIAELLDPIILIIAFSLILKCMGAVIQPIGEDRLYSLFGDLSKDIEYLLAGILTVAFMYALIVMLIINSANTFI